MTTPSIEELIAAFTQTNQLHEDADICTADIINVLQSQAERIKVLEAKVEQLKVVPMKYRRMEFNAQLQKENETLRTALAQQGEQTDQRLVNLLCRIHRDGGHYITKHGIDKAVIDADVRVAQLNALTDTAAPAPVAQQGEQQPVAWRHDCNALLTNSLELWIDHCPHCGKPRTTHAEQWPPGLITDIVLTVTALHKEVDIGWSPDARSHLLRLSTSIGMLAAAPAPQPAQEATTGCACRWDTNDNRVATCVRHQGWLDVVSEWADRAKAAESALQSAQPVAPLTDGQIEDIGFEMLYEVQRKDFIAFARAIEAAHGIKGVK